MTADLKADLMRQVFLVYKRLCMQFLPPKAQKLFSKNADRSLVAMDPDGLLSLKDLGFPYPGPHDVWLQCNLQAIFGDPVEGRTCP